MKTLSLITLGLWVILQSTYGPLATKLGLIAGVPSSSPDNSGSGSTPGPGAPNYGSTSGGGLGATPSGPNYGTSGGGLGGSPGSPNYGTSGGGLGASPAGPNYGT